MSGNGVPYSTNANPLDISQGNLTAKTNPFDTSSSILGVRAAQSFTLAADPPFLLGDANRDGYLTNDDLTLILNARNTPASGTPDPRDFDGDKKITVLDARKFTLLLSGNTDKTPPIIAAGLANDTAPDGKSNQDGITSNPTITGTVKDASIVTHFWAGFDDTPVDSFVNIFGVLGSNEHFSLNQAQLEQILGQSLSDGKHVLHLQAADEWRNISQSYDVAFTLDTANPVVKLTNQLDKATLRDGAILSGTVDGTGSGVTVFSYNFDNLPSSSIAFNSNGVFDQALNLTGIAAGSHTLTLTASDIAGNTATYSYKVTVASSEAPSVVKITTQPSTDYTILRRSSSLITGLPITTTKPGLAEIQGQTFLDIDLDGTPFSKVVAGSDFPSSVAEPGIDGFVVQLVNPNTGEVMASQVTQSVDLNNDGRIDPITEQGIYRFTNLQPGTYLVKEVASDGWHLSAPPTPSTYTITLNSGDKKTGVNFGEAQNYFYQAQAIDSNSNNLITYSLLEAPTTATIDAKTGKLTWTPTTVGQYSFKLKASDVQGGQDSQSFTVNVFDPNIAPSFTSTPIEQAQVGQSYTYQLAITNPDFDALSFKLNQASVGMTISRDGLIQWTPQANQIGAQQVNAVVQDNRGGQTTQAFTILTTGAKSKSTDNHAPVIISNPVFAGTTTQPYTYTVAAVDADGNSLKYSLVQAPQEMSIDPTSGVISWNTASQTVGNYQVNVKVEDGQGGSDSQAFTLALSNVATGTIQGTVTNTPATPTKVYLDTNNNGILDPGEPTQLVTATGNTNPNLTVQAGDVIFLAGRTDVTIPPLGVTNSPSYPIGRFGFTGANILQERFPQSVSAQAGENFTFSATGKVTYDFRGRPFIRPDGDPTQSIPINISGLAGISGYSGLEGQLVGVFLSNTNPLNTTAPETLDFRANDPQGIGTSFTKLSPKLGQVFFIGDGLTGTGTGDLQNFIAPTGATNLYLGFADGFGFGGAPGAYDDNGGSLQVTVRGNMAKAGQYQFTGLLPGNYTVREIVPNGYTQLLPTAPTNSSNTGSYTVNLGAGSVVNGNDFTNKSTGLIDNSPPKFITAAPTTAIVNTLLRYQAAVIDPNGDTFTYSLITKPAGMAVDPKSGIVVWRPTSDQNGSYDVVLQAQNDQGVSALQSFKLMVAGADTEAPVVKLQGSTNVANLGSNVKFLVSATDNVGVVSRALSVNGTSITLDADGSATIPENKAGLFQIVATATDAAGNVGKDTFTLRVIDPTDQSTPQIQIISPQSNNSVAKMTDIIGTITDKNLEFYRVEYAPIDQVDLNNLSAPNANFITLSQGNANITNGVLGEFNPNLLLNGNYVIRVTAQNTNGGINIQGIILGVSGAQKLGNFRLEQTDLSIPLAGIPIEVKRVYDTLQANQLGDFGYGWSLGVQDARIQESVPLTALEKQGGSDIAPNPFIYGTKVYLTDPDGQRVGFTFTPTAQSGLLGAIWTPKFTPDAGVNETLSVDDITLEQKSNGTFGLYLFGLPYNPSTYKLTTKDGVVYSYDQFKGLQQIKDRSGNTLTFDSTGITSSTGVKVNFVRDAQGRISDVIDPSGKKIHYEYDVNGNLIDTIDRTNSKTQFTYDTTRQHYLKNIIDPLGNNVTRTEYDDQGKLARIIDAKGNVVNINTNIGNVASAQTITDGLGNPTTLIYDDRGNVIRQVNAQNGVTERTYDSNNNLLSLTDPLGNRTTYSYDAQGNLLSQTNPLGQTKTYTYNTFNQVLTTTDALGNKTQNTYDAQGNLLSTLDAAGFTTTYTYNSQGNVTSVTNTLNGVTRYEYDEEGRIVSITDALNQKQLFTYDANGNLTSINTPLNHTTQFTYDANGRPLTITDAQGNVSQLEYNAAGDRTASIDALGRRTKYTYNALGQLTQILYADGTTEQFTYDVNGRKISATDRALGTTNYVYDSLGRLVDTIEPDNTPTVLTDNPQVRREYDASGRLTAIVDERGNRTAYIYDAAGQLIAVRDANGNQTTSTYNANGQLTSITDALKHTTQYTYDVLGQAIATRYADNTNTITTRDALGRIIAQTDSAGVTTQYTYDALGRLTGVIDALSQRTEYGYDAEGNLISQKDAKGNVTTYTYNAVKEQVATTLPLGQKTTSTYDAVGNLVSTTDFNGQTTIYQYNTNNQVTTKKFGDGTSLTYTYTPTLQQATAKDVRGVTTYSYDERDRLIQVTQPDGKTIRYTYDLSGNKTSETTTAGTVSYTYDAVNNLQTVTDPISKITTYTYNAVGDLTKTQLPNGIQETRQYDSLDRLTNLQQIGADGTIASYTYTLDSTGKRLSETNANGRKVNYTYDSLGRLTQEAIVDPTTGNRTIKYTYDVTGNRLTRVDTVEGTTTYTYDANDRLLTEVLNGKTTQYSYDNNGNTLTVKVNGAIQETYGWDAQGKLISAIINTAQGVQNIQYRYDANGNRVATLVNGQETRYLVDTQGEYSQVLETYAPNGTPQTAYVRGLNLISQTQQGIQSFNLTDGLGSVRALTNLTGKVTDQYTYDAFGRLIGQQGNTLNTVGFTGEQFDPTTNLYNLRARNYDPNTGRFISRDSFGGFLTDPQSLQKYTYAQNNPVNLVDPSGNSAIEEGGILRVTPVEPPNNNKPRKTPLEIVKEFEEAIKALEKPQGR